MIAPNVLLDDSLARFARTVALDDRDRASLEGLLAARSGVNPAALGIDQLVGQRETALLVIHDHGDPEVPFEHGARLAQAWREATLRSTEGLGHRRILRDANVIGLTVGFVSHGVQPPASELVREIDRLLGDDEL
jgi:hypothetical protein